MYPPLLLSPALLLNTHTVYIHILISLPPRCLYHHLKRLKILYFQSRYLHLIMLLFPISSNQLMIILNRILQKMQKSEISTVYTLVWHICFLLLHWNVWCSRKCLIPRTHVDKIQHRSLMASGSQPRPD